MSGSFRRAVSVESCALLLDAQIGQHLMQPQTPSGARTVRLHDGVFMGVMHNLQ